MAPKTEASDGSNSFLVTCIKCAKAKLEVDFDAVAKATGMSRGGVANKFRAMMKTFEEEGATWTQNESHDKPAPKRKVAPRKTTIKSNVKVEDGDSSEEEKPPAKKAKAKVAPKKKGTLAAENKKQVAEASTSEGEDQDDAKTAVDSPDEEDEGEEEE